MRNRRGFIVIVVIGLLAVMLSVGVGFLSHTRGEVRSVAHIRDKIDCSDLAESALDWTLGCIAQTLFDPVSGQVKEDAWISNSRSAADGHFWYKPLEPGLSKVKTMQGVADVRDEARWVYTPQDYFNVGGNLRGRFRAQVLDTNAFLNMNDWNEDCTPSQCQMAHMMMDAIAYGDNELRRYQQRKLIRLTTEDPMVNGQTVADPNRAATSYMPIRYFEAWRIASRTLRNAYPDPPSFAPYFTTNTCWMDSTNTAPNAVWSALALEEFPDIAQSGGPAVHVSVNWRNYVDPDTGRSPLNVNTAYCSGDTLPVYPFVNSTSYGSRAFEGVFNIESLKRIIKVGTFFGASGAFKNAQVDPLSDADRVVLNDLTTRLACRYQEILCRYFCASYQRGAPGIGYGIGAVQKKNYYDTYGPALGAGVNLVRHAVRFSDYSKTRFPCGVAAFRQWVADDLRAMTQNNNVAPAAAYSGPVYMGADKDGEDLVNFDAAGTPEILPGKLDQRTAAAVYDNIVPGKAMLFPGHAKPGVADPLGELYARRLGRDENSAVRPHESLHYAFYNDAVRQFYDELLPAPPAGPGGFKINHDRGREIEGADVPDRQLAFGRDWFSTELTTASTTFLMVVTAQVVDTASGLDNPQVLSQHQRVLVVEMAPDTAVESGGDWPNSGLGYYSGGWPARRKADKSVMDLNSAHVDGATGSTSTWRDFRGWQPANYKAPGQTRKRIIIRAVYDVNQQMTM
jgi:hypothetical protein